MCVHLWMLVKRTVMPETPPPTRVMPEFLYFYLGIYQSWFCGPKTGLGEIKNWFKDSFSLPKISMLHKLSFANSTDIRRGLFLLSHPRTKTCIKKALSQKRGGKQFVTRLGAFSQRREKGSGLMAPAEQQLPKLVAFDLVGWRPLECVAPPNLNARIYKDTCASRWHWRICLHTSTAGLLNLPCLRMKFSGGLSLQDGTLWWPEMYMLSGAPFKKDSSGAVFDR